MLMSSDFIRSKIEKDDPILCLNSYDPSHEPEEEIAPLRSELKTKNSRVKYFMFGENRIKSEIFSKAIINLKQLDMPSKSTTVIGQTEKNLSSINMRNSWSLCSIQVC